MRKIAAISCIIIVLSPLCYSESSVIFNLQSAAKSIVNLKVDTGGAVRQPIGMARDPRTGRIVIAHKILAAQITRNGAGVIIDPSGLIVTNAHTIDKAGRIIVSLYDGTETQADIVKILPKEDIAFIKISTDSSLKPLKFANSNELKLHSRVFNIGSSQAIKGVISEGIITGIGQTRKSRSENTDFVDLIQVSFSVYKGDSGAPILDENGGFLGIIVGGMKGVSHISYAIPSTKIAKLLLILRKDMMSK